MKIFKYPITAFLIALIAGTYFGYQFNIHSNIVLIITGACFLLLLVVFIWKKIARSPFFGFIVLSFFASFGMCNALLHSHKNPHHYSRFYQPGNPLSIQVTKELKPSRYYYKYVAEVTKTAQTDTQGKVLLMVPKSDSLPRLFPDMQLIARASLHRISPPPNPHQFNYKKYLEQHGMYHQLKIDNTNTTIVSKQVETALGHAYILRNKIVKKLQPFAGKEELAVMKALLLGQRQGISPETYQQYANAGVIHLLAISGLHIGIILLFLNFLFRPLDRYKNGKAFKTVLIILLLWGFAIVAGLSASVVRAVTMFSFIAYAMQLNRLINIYHAIISSMFFLLIFKPNFIFDVGFQLSYTAVLGIVWIQPVIVGFVRIKNRVLNYFWSLMAVTLAAQLSVLPLTLFYFHQFPGLFFLSNLVLVPLIGILLGAGFLNITAALLNILPGNIAGFYFDLIGFMNLFVEWIASKEAFLFKNISFNALEMVLSYFSIILFVSLLKKFSWLRCIAVSGCFMALTGLIKYEDYEVGQQYRFIVFHQYKQSILAVQNGGSLSINTASLPSYVRDYAIDERISTFQNKACLSFPNTQVIDSNALYGPGKTDILVLTHSPKINLDRLILRLCPKQIVADGSNYPSFVQKWKQSCAKYHIPFHYTAENGAFIIRK